MTLITFVEGEIIGDGSFSESDINIYIIGSMGEREMEDDDSIYLRELFLVRVSL